MDEFDIMDARGVTNRFLTGAWKSLFSGSTVSYIFDFGHFKSFLGYICSLLHDLFNFNFILMLCKYILQEFHAVFKQGPSGIHHLTSNTM